MQTNGCGWVHDSTTRLVFVVGVGICAFYANAQDPAPSSTWNNGVRAILDANCGACHVAGGVGPFALDDYDSVVRRTTFLTHVLDEGLMPPWLPSGSEVFRGERVLTDEDRTTLQKWIDAGAPKGEPAKHTPSVPSSTNTANGNRVTAKMRTPWRVPSEGGKRWFKAERDKRTFVLPLNNDAPLRVQALRYESKSPIALAAVALSADATGNARRIVDWDEEPGSYMMGDFGFVAAGSLAVVGPGGGALQLPAGFHLAVPAQADIVSEVHFRPQGRAWELNDHVMFDVVDDSAVSRELVPVNVMVRKIELDAGERKRFTNELTMPMDTELVAITPRASRRCVAIKLEAIFPGVETPQLLLEIDDWNPHYRTTLVLETPRALPAQTIVRVQFDYDNSADNTRNPVVPPEAVSLGARTGSANVLLLCAPSSISETKNLHEFSRRVIRTQQR